MPSIIKFHIYSCQGCDPRVYGSSCNKSCPINCKDNMCQIQYGACFVCKLGWIWTFCNTSKESQTLDKIIQIKTDARIPFFRMRLHVAYMVNGEKHLQKYCNVIVSSFIAQNIRKSFHNQIINKNLKCKMKNSIHLSPKNIIHKYRSLMNSMQRRLVRCQLQSAV